MHRLELGLVAMLSLVGAAVIWQMRLLHPPLAEIVTGAAMPTIPDRAAMLIAAGIIGATVMPHNLFLHSALFKEKCGGESESTRTRLGRFFTAETFLALIIATFVNAAILIVAADANSRGSSFTALHSAIYSRVGAIAAAIFGSGLILSGLASSATATLSSD